MLQKSTEPLLSLKNKIQIHTCIHLRVQNKTVEDKFSKFLTVATSEKLELEGKEETFKFIESVKESWTNLNPH